MHLAITTIRRSTAARTPIARRSDRNVARGHEEAHPPPGCTLAASGKKFGVSLADPPWRHPANAGEDSAADQYDTTSVNDIKALPVQMLVAKDSVLMLWGV